MPPEWRLPAGVTRGVWDYLHSPQIASQYDAYFAEEPLFEFDQQVLTEEFVPPGVVADLGCGTGRALLPLVQAGHTGIAIDLSEHMLNVVAAKAASAGLDVACVQANLVDLAPVADACCDYAMCLYNTLGMVRGRANRRAALASFARILRPGGKLVLHAHNWWFNLRDPGGPWWLLRNAAQSMVRSDVELGDKYFHYRGVQNFYLHVFRAGELKRDLQGAGFTVQSWRPLDPKRRQPLNKPWLAPSLRASGWIITSQRLAADDLR